MNENAIPTYYEYSDLVRLEENHILIPLSKSKKGTAGSEKVPSPPSNKGEEPQYIGDLPLLRFKLRQTLTGYQPAREKQITKYDINDRNEIVRVRIAIPLYWDKADTEHKGEKIPEPFQTFPGQYSPAYLEAFKEEFFKTKNGKMQSDYELKKKYHMTNRAIKDLLPIIREGSSKVDIPLSKEESQNILLIRLSCGKDRPFVLAFHCAMIPLLGNDNKTVIETRHHISLFHLSRETDFQKIIDELKRKIPFPNSVSCICTDMSYEWMCALENAFINSTVLLDNCTLAISINDFVRLSKQSNLRRFRLLKKRDQLLNLFHSVNKREKKIEILNKIVKGLTDIKEEVKSRSKNNSLVETMDNVLKQRAMPLKRTPIEKKLTYQFRQLCFVTSLSYEFDQKILELSHWGKPYSEERLVEHLLVLSNNLISRSIEIRNDYEERMRRYDKALNTSDIGPGTKDKADAAAEAIIEEERTAKSDKSPFNRNTDFGVHAYDIKYADMKDGFSHNSEISAKPLAAFPKFSQAWECPLYDVLQCESHMLTLNASVPEQEQEMLDIIRFMDELKATTISAEELLQDCFSSSPVVDFLYGRYNADYLAWRERIPQAAFHSVVIDSIVYNATINGTDTECTAYVAIGIQLPGTDFKPGTKEILGIYDTAYDILHDIKEKGIGSALRIYCRESIIENEMDNPAFSDLVWSDDFTVIIPDAYSGVRDILECADKNDAILLTEDISYAFLAGTWENAEQRLKQSAQRWGSKYPNVKDILAENKDDLKLFYSDAFPGDNRFSYYSPVGIAAAYKHLQDTVNLVDVYPSADVFKALLFRHITEMESSWALFSKRRQW